ncbi:allatostatin-A receptor [Strongylocentrotus purpuratus]|uniref:G-protein coupled receptors family 1 profile domain-containing protein n=1 Tax=Strongylocentrotus purpuratus TaxID=7668 RepID=A0A7M7HMB0_STRPU|nr:allatostatin-A receptor [Strongylocentrotus purpuratus]
MVTDQAGNVTDIYMELYTELYTDWSTGTPDTQLRISDEAVTAEINGTDAAEDHNGWMFEPFVLSAFVILQIIIAVLGIVGNIFVLLATSRGKKNLKTTNILVCALAVADLLTSFMILPYPNVQSVPKTILGELYCKVVASRFFMWTSVVASIFTLTAISIERYLAISHPFFHRRAVTRKGIRTTIVIIWIVAFFLNINPFFVEYVDSHSCVFKYRHRDLAGREFYGGIVFLTEFLTPSAIMMTTHILASRTLNRGLARFKNTQGCAGPRANLIVAKKRNMDSLLIIFLTFVMCWGPYQVLFLLFNSGVLDHTYLEGVAYSCTVLLALFHSCANPLIYTIRFPIFRSVILSMLSCCGDSGMDKNARVNMFMSDDTI